MTLHRDRVLIVEDEFLIGEALRYQVEDLGLTVCGVAMDAETAVRMAVSERPFLVLSDVRLGAGRDGVDAAAEIRDTVGSKVIFITGSREPSTLKRIQREHPAPVLFKPVSDAGLRAAVTDALMDPPATP